jgi:quercetin dioxygenase-like cupin family protein
MKRTTIAALVAGVFSIAAQAGECPADKRVADGQGQKMVTHGPRDVTDNVIASTDLGAEKLGLKEHMFRARKLVIKPGGIVPWHSHDERPAMIYIVSGEVVEYASNCLVPIVHRGGDVAAEKKGVSHWWKNTGTEKALLISVDLFPGEAKMDEHVM